jgi:hypothetical protein
MVWVKLSYYGSLNDKDSKLVESRLAAGWGNHGSMLGEYWEFSMSLMGKPSFSLCDTGFLKVTNIIELKLSNSIIHIKEISSIHALNVLQIWSQNALIENLWVLVIVAENEKILQITISK